MKYAYYEFVANEEEKQARLNQIKAEAGQDPDYYSAYLEIAPSYNASIRELKALKALNMAIQRGRVQTVVISSIRNFYMEEEHALGLLLRFMEKGVQLAVGSPSNVQTEDDLFAKAADAQMEYLITVLSIPMVTMEECVVRRICDTPSIRLLSDRKDEKLEIIETKMLFVDAVKKYRDTGFIFYRSDVKGWYRVSNYMAEKLLDFFDICYKTLFESMDL